MALFNNFILAAISALAGVAVGCIVSLPRKLRSKKQEQLQLEEERLIGLQEKFQDSETELSTRLKAVEQAIGSLLRSEIQILYEQLMDRGYATTHEKANLSYLLNSYKGLGLNSYITKLGDQLMDLPTKERDEG